jgi:hypothetical protein
VRFLDTLGTKRAPDVIVCSGAIGKVAIVEIKGKIIEILPEKSGQSANGEWRKQEYVLETDTSYPKKICFMAWGDKIGEFNLQQGENVEVSVDLESREYNGRWYTDVKAWKVSKDGMGADNAYANREQDNNEIENESKLSLDGDDIPF